MKPKIQATLSSALIFANRESHNPPGCETSVQRENMVPEDRRTVTACVSCSTMHKVQQICLRGSKPGTPTSAVEKDDCFLPE